MELFDWDDLLHDIEEQNAVLVLGRGFLPTAHTELGIRLQEKLKDKLLHIYEREGFFLFSDSVAKTIAQKETARFYKKCSLEEDVLKKIIQLPFPLIVSANPDKLLLDTFSEYRIPAQFDYFSSQFKTQEYKIERPDRDKPLIYNLCGSIEDRESLILDYDDLFQMLKVMLGDTKIPNEVRLPLLKTTTYVFLGFNFERWYTQLFLRYLNMDESRFSNRSSNYVLKTSFKNDDAEEFFLQQFNVKYIGADWDFFHELYDRFSKKFPQKLRQIAEPYSPTTRTIIQLVEKSDYRAAFRLMKTNKDLFYADDQQVLTHTMATYSEYEQLKTDGTSTQEHLTILLARVRKNVIHLSKQLA